MSKVFTYTAADVAAQFGQAIPDCDGDDGGLYEIVAAHSQITSAGSTYPSRAIIDALMRRLVDSAAVRRSQEQFAADVADAIGSSYPELDPVFETSLMAEQDFRRELVSVIECALSAYSALDPSGSVVITYRSGGLQTYRKLCSLAGAVKTVYLCENYPEKVPLPVSDILPDAVAEIRRLLPAYRRTRVAA